MDLTQTILELKENTSKLVERMATQSDKWDQQIKDLVKYGKSKIDGFIAGARKEYPALNLYKNPLFKGEKGKDFSFGGWNPRKHKYTYEAVPWDYNDITKQWLKK